MLPLHALLIFLVLSFISLLLYALNILSFSRLICLASQSSMLLYIFCILAYLRLEKSLIAKLIGGLALIICIVFTVQFGRSLWISFLYVTVGVVYQNRILLLVKFSDYKEYLYECFMKRYFSIK
ncbi:hypothetical protein AVI51_12415 [Piscirickettsia salmonis]|nr:hypothetical protein AVI50_12525 [Piscirickettsia salmonis]APS54786.1 hypothetical protein AVI51_12415 [Piscirickettsia salmonis]APS57897.1 hypothetical protein AVI52_11995 [Piscirickettsia salmonis]ERL61003.1 putative membrane protein [Piscirickettsia salmonis LF-89 = ATCC VR-1361]